MPKCAAGLAIWKNTFTASWANPLSSSDSSPSWPLAPLLWTAVTLKMNWFQHPKLIRTTYRMPEKHGSAFEAWEELHRKFASPEFSVQVELQHAKQRVWMRLEGALSRNNAEGLAHRISESLARSKNHLVLDLKKLQWDKSTDLKPMREKLAEYRSRIRVVLPKLSAAHSELILIASLFNHYR